MIVGLIVNPIAGIGGPAGLKGSDGPEIQLQALARGAVARSGRRAAAAVAALVRHRPDVVIRTVPGAMGADHARAAQVMALTPGEPVTPAAARPVRGCAGVGGPAPHRSTTAADTRAAVRALHDVDLLLFAGGDGTARDVLDAGPGCPILGVPAGVKVYSGCFAISPASAGLIAAEFTGDSQDAEVVDLDEEAYRGGRVGPRLYGTVRVPAARVRLSGRKASTPPGSAEGVARELVSRMRPGIAYLLGPGSTTQAVGRELGLATTLLGVDVVRDRRLIARDVTEAELFALVREAPAEAVLSIVGGQGFVLGRGNQQVSSRVLRELRGLTVLGTQQKLAGLAGRPLLTDTGDPKADAQVAGFVPVITGYRESTRYRLTSASEVA